MNDTFKILTQKEKGQSHRQTELTIDWQGMDLHKMQALARSALVHIIQIQFKKGILPIPDEMTVRATDFVHEEVRMILEDRPIPERKPKSVTVSAAGWVEKMLAALPEDERQKVINELRQQQ